MIVLPVSGYLEHDLDMRIESWFITGGEVRGSVISKLVGARREVAVELCPGPVHHPAIRVGVSLGNPLPTLFAVAIQFDFHTGDRAATGKIEDMSGYLVGHQAVEFLNDEMFLNNLPMLTV